MRYIKSYRFSSSRFPVLKRFPVAQRGCLKGLLSKISRSLSSREVACWGSSRGACHLNIDRRDTRMLGGVKLATFQRLYPELVDSLWLGIQSTQSPLPGVFVETMSQMKQSIQRGSRRMRQESNKGCHHVREVISQGLFSVLKALFV